MLNPDYLEHITDDLMRKHIEKAIDDIITDAARRIKKTGTITETVNWQVLKLEQLSAYHDYVLQKLARAVNMSEGDLLKLFNDVAVETLREDDKIYRAAGYDPVPLKDNAYMQGLIWSTVERTRGTLENLTRTTADTATRQFEQILDQAHFRLASGAFSIQEVVRWGVKELAGKGIASIIYPTDHVDYADVAFRRATLTGLNQAGLKLQERRANEMGCDYVETTAHMGARPSHALWQGRVFKLHGSEPGYPNFYDETGYGTGAGLGGWNCRHGWYPFFPGLSEPANTKAYLDELNNATVTYNGKKLSMYDATQEQRRFERNIRKWKREYKALTENGEDATEAAVKLREWRQREADFRRQTKLPYQGSREQVVGFGRSEAAKAAWAVKRESVAMARAHENEKTIWLENGNVINAEEYRSLKQYANERNIQLRGFKKYDGDVSLIKEFIDGMYRVAQDYPEVNTAFKGGLQLVNNKRMSPDDYAEAGRHSSININTAAFRNRDLLKKDYEEQVTAKWFASGTSYQSISYHEMGHVLQNVYKFSARDVIGDVDSGKISLYAASSPNEGVAETVSAIYSGSKSEEALTIWERCNRIIAIRRR